VLYGWVVWPCALVAAAIVWRRGVAAATPRRALAARIALALYLGWLAGETFFPLPVTAAALHAGIAAHPGGGWHADLVPFRSISHLAGLGWQWPVIRLLAGNVCVFVPFGVLLPMAWAGMARWRRVALAALALSVSVELGQLTGSLLVGYSYRVTEIDDVILNVTGVLLGFALWATARRLGLPDGPAEGPPAGLEVRQRPSEPAVLRDEQKDDHGHGQQRDHDGPPRDGAQAITTLGLLE
jgi:glycopeptide antibiotics resistance protein